MNGNDLAFAADSRLSILHSRPTLLHRKLQYGLSNRPLDWILTHIASFMVPFLATYCLCGRLFVPNRRWFRKHGRQRLPMKRPEVRVAYEDESGDLQE